LKLNGEENAETLTSANNYATSLFVLRRFEEAKSLLRRLLPVARRVLGDNNVTMLMMRSNYAKASYKDPDATLDSLRETVATLDELEPSVRRVFGSANPTTKEIEGDLRNARAALRARETLPPGGGKHN